MSWLLDTCALSEYAKKAPASQVITWLDEQDEASLYFSVSTLGETGKGILKRRATDARRSQKLTAWLGKVEQLRATGSGSDRKARHHKKIPYPIMGRAQSTLLPRHPDQAGLRAA